MAFGFQASRQVLQPAELGKGRRDFLGAFCIFVPLEAVSSLALSLSWSKYVCRGFWKPCEFQAVQLLQVGVGSALHLICYCSFIPPTQQSRAVNWIMA